MTVNFVKMHGLSNDFVIVDCRNGAPVLTEREVVDISDRKTGVGCDQVIHILSPRSPETDAYLDMYNRDGSSLRACGNATRCVASLLMKEKGDDRVTIETVAGLLSCRAVDKTRERIEVDMGAPKLEWRDIPLSQECDTLHVPLDIRDYFSIENTQLRKEGEEAGKGVAVNIGNPHCVFFVEDCETLNIEAIGPRLEHHPLFPDRANIEFCHVIDREHIRMRVWERGTGVTAACGSGACAVIVAAVQRGLSERKCEIILDGGSLTLHWREDDGHILMTGPVAYVFEGTFYE